MQLHYRERMEDIIKIDYRPENEHELKYICKEFYHDIQKHLYGL